jgi:AcrR family transcriptional regulator
MPDRAIDTPTRILDTALGLFNERGTANVTTNHIAEAMGISPGNLDDHFGNKPEIVRGLFARILAAWSANDTLPQGAHHTFKIMDVMAAGNFEIQWAHRFFFRDLTMLLASDPELAADYRRNRDVGMSNTLALLRDFISASLMQPADTRTRDDLTQLLWLVGDFRLVFRDAGGKAPTRADMDQGVRLLRRVLPDPRKPSETQSQNAALRVRAAPD